MNGHIVGKVLIFIRSSIQFRLELEKKKELILHLVILNIHVLGGKQNVRF